MPGDGCGDVTEQKALAIALMPAERDLILSALRLLEEFEADTELTRPVIELFEKALTVREAQRAAAGMTS